MKLVRYHRNGAVRLGAIDGDDVVDLLDAAPVGTDTEHLAAFSDMTRLIEAGEAGVDAVRAGVASGQARTKLAQVKLAAPVEPTLILCSGAKMIWTCAQLVEFFSTFVTLRPGVVISTGTPRGTAWGTDPELGGKKPMRKDVVAPKGYLQVRDEVVCRIEGLGELRNRVVDVVKTKSASDPKKAKG